jgi:hypothetical protein
MLFSTFQEVGVAVGLEEVALARYVAYMLCRWAHKERELCSTHYSEYAITWAKRFKEGLEYQASDCNGIAVLQAIDGGECD